MQYKKFQVKFKTATGHMVTELFDLTPHSNGFVPDYNLRALALHWTVIEVIEL